MGQPASTWRRRRWAAPTCANLRILQKDVTRAQLVSGARNPESVGFNLFDTAGQRRVWLALKQGRVVGTTGDLTGIAMLVDQQRIRVHIGVDGNGDPFIWLLDVDGNPVFLATNKYNLQVTIERWPKVGFHATREHGERLVHA